MIEKFDDDFVYVTGCDLYFMDITEKLVISLLNTSNRKIIVYGINCEVPFDYPNLIKKTVYYELKDKDDMWFWKQKVCIESLREEYENYVWLDGDVLCNNNVDNISTYFNEIENYPISNIHVKDELALWFSDGRLDQYFNEHITNEYGVPRKIFQNPLHVCFFVYNKRCDWFFQEILDIRKYLLEINRYDELSRWHDEGLTNFLHCKYGFKKHLPMSDLSLLNAPDELNIFYGYWNDPSPNNFENEENPFNSCYVPENKEQILIYHENKNLEHADEIIQFVKLQKYGLHNSKYFFVDKHKVKKFNHMQPEPPDYHPEADFKFDDVGRKGDQTSKFEYKELIYIKKDDVVVDIGADIGYFERYCYLKGASKVICFEPDNEKFELLKLNSSPISDIVNGSVENIDNLFIAKNLKQIDFLKVDHKGGEFSIINSISDNNLQKINRISVKYYHSFYNFADDLRDNFISKLLHKGFNSMNYMENDINYIHFYR